MLRDREPAEEIGQTITCSMALLFLAADIWIACSKYEHEHGNRENGEAKPSYRAWPPS